MKVFFVNIVFSEVTVNQKIFFTVITIIRMEIFLFSQSDWRFSACQNRIFSREEI